MELLLLLIQTAWTERVHSFFDSFEQALSNKFSVDSWHAGLALIDPSLPAGALSSSGPHPLPPRWTRRLSSKIFPVETHNIRDLVENPRSSSMQPGVGWISGESMAGLEKSLFGIHPLLPELSMSAIDGLSASSDRSVPRVVALLLRLLAIPLPKMQETTFRYAWVSDFRFEAGVCSSDLGKGVRFLGQACMLYFISHQYSI